MCLLSSRAKGQAQDLTVLCVREPGSLSYLNRQEELSEECVLLRGQGLLLLLPLTTVQGIKVKASLVVGYHASTI